MVKYIHDYYKILGVEADATGEEIKKAYKRAVLKYHPDVNKTDKSGRKFKLIRDAYVVLSSDVKRKNYDRLRKVAMSKNQIAKRNSDISLSGRHNRSNTLDTISKGVELATNLENETGLFSNLLSIITGSDVSRFNRSGSFSAGGSSGRMKHRHRKGRKF